MRLFLIVILLCSITSGSKILFVVFPSSKSHLGSMLPFAEALSKHGHDVTMYVETIDDLGELKNDVKGHYVRVSEETYKDLFFLTPFMEVVWNHDYSPQMMLESLRLGCTSLLEAVEQDSFWKIANQTWDLIIGDEISTPTGWGLGLLHKKRDGTPHAVSSTTDMLQTFTTFLSLNRNPVIAPSYYISHDEPFWWHVENFFDRTIAMRHAILEYVIVGNIIQWVTRSVLQHMDYNNNFSWKNYYQDVSIVFNDYPERMAWPIPIGTDIVFTGSICREAYTLPTQLEEFVSDPTSKGTILIAFGSYVEWDMAPRRIVDSLLEAVNNMTDYRIIWGYKGTKLEVKSHVKLMEWMPQNDLLNHPKTKLFISHGGLKSLKEAICSATPVLYMPLFCEQARTALIAKQLGFAEYLNKKTIDAQRVVSQMSKVLDNDSYRKEVTKLKTFTIDRIIDPLDEAVFWGEKLIRYGEMQLVFRRAGMKLNWMQFLFVDFAFLLICAMFIVGSSVTIVLLQKLS